MDERTKTALMRVYALLSLLWIVPLGYILLLFIEVMPYAADLSILAFIALCAVSVIVVLMLFSIGLWRMRPSLLLSSIVSTIFLIFGVLMVFGYTNINHELLYGLAAIAYGLIGVLLRNAPPFHALFRKPLSTTTKTVKS